MLKGTKTPLFFFWSTTKKQTHLIFNYSDCSDIAEFFKSDFRLQHKQQLCFFFLSLALSLLNPDLAQISTKWLRAAGETTSTAAEA